MRHRLRRGRAKYVKTATAGAVAAMIVEPLQGTAGNIAPPVEFLPAMKSIADEADALFIADEMITGLGRTGQWWGVHHSGVVPDIVTIGKAFGGGFPLSGLATTDEILEGPAVVEPVGVVVELRRQPAGRRRRRGLAARHRGRGPGRQRPPGSAQVLLEELRGWVDRYPFVGHVGGAGLLAGIELVTDKTTKEPLPRPVTERIFAECVRRGLLTMAYSPHVRIQPPLTTDETTLRNGLAVLAEVFDEVARAGWWKA